VAFVCHSQSYRVTPSLTLRALAVDDKTTTPLFA
jgi:hypothetical protein